MIQMEMLQGIIKGKDFLPLLLCVAEITFCISHLLVHLGLKNPRLVYLTHQAMYFSLDCFLSTLNLIYFWDKYNILRPLLIYAILVHVYYVADLLIHNGKSRIFLWSCVDCQGNRFDMKYLKENLETLLDVTCHFFGAYNFFFVLDHQMASACVFLSIFLLWIGMVHNKDFFTLNYMMPKWLNTILGRRENKIN
jgi:hypothetical protein